MDIQTETAKEKSTPNASSDLIYGLIQKAVQSIETNQAVTL